MTCASFVGVSNRPNHSRPAFTASPATCPSAAPTTVAMSTGLLPASSEIDAMIRVRIRTAMGDAKLMAL
ncbi:MAG: hypothetical protein ACLGIK_11265, partial [Gemmatimonadota bacterium]